MANHVDPDQRQHFVASDLGLYCLLRPVIPNILGCYGIINWLTQTKRHNAESKIQNT